MEMVLRTKTWRFLLCTDWVLLVRRPLEVLKDRFVRSHRLTKLLYCRALFDKVC